MSGPGPMRSPMTEAEFTVELNRADMRSVAAMLAPPGSVPAVPRGPVEVAILATLPEPLHTCPICGAEPFRLFWRGHVQRWPWSWRTLWLPIGRKRPYCALICSTCKEIVGHESPNDRSARTVRPAPPLQP